MSRWMRVELENESAYARESTTLILGGLCAGASGGLLAMLAGQGHDQLLALSFGAIIGLFANLGDRQESRGTLRLVMAIMAGTSMALLLQVQPLIAGAAGGIMLGAALGMERVKGAVARKVLEAGSYALLLMAGVFTTRVLFGQGALTFADVPMLRPVLEGSVWGLFLAMAAGVNRLRWMHDETSELFDAALIEAGSEEREVLRCGRDLYGRIMDELGNEGRRQEGEDDLGEQARAIATDTAQHLVLMTRRTDELRRLLTRGRTREIEERYERTRVRREASTDPAIRQEFGAALAELDEQRSMGQRIELARARLEARQQRCITALERLHLALIHNSAALTESVGLQDALSSLQRLTEEMHWKSLPVDELLALERDEAMNPLDEIEGDAHLEESKKTESESISPEESSQDAIECPAGAERSH